MKLLPFLQDLQAIWYFDNRFSLLLDKTIFKSSGGDLHIYRKNGMEILMDKSAGDQSGARYAITSPMYKQYLSHIMPIVGNKPLHILDLGANVGGFSLLLALEKIPIESLVAVELNPNTFLRLRLNLERNLSIPPSHLFCINAGVCGESRILQVTLGKGGMDDNIFDKRQFALKNEHKYSIQGVTFDEIITQNLITTGEQKQLIDICKMDIEGAEYEIILGQHSTYLQYCKFLIIEIHPHTQYSFEDIIAAIKKEGFEEIQTGVKISEDVFLFRNIRIT